jgi:hypothetical protein
MPRVRRRVPRAAARGVVVEDMDRARGPTSNIFSETARFHLYKYFTQWQFQGEPLGSGKRAKLPDCFEWVARDTFKSPACCAGCDLLRGCETAGQLHGVPHRGGVQGEGLQVPP